MNLKSICQPSSINRDWNLITPTEKNKMNTTKNITPFIGLFALAFCFNEVALSQQPSSNDLRQQIRPAADILSEWHRAQNETIDEARRQIVANQERIRNSQVQREAEMRANQAEIARLDALSKVEFFQAFLNDCLRGDFLRDSRLRSEAQVLQTETTRLLEGRGDARQIDSSRENLERHLQGVLDRQEASDSRQSALDNVRRFQTELDSEVRRLQDVRLRQEAQGIQNEIRRLLGSQADANQIEDSLTVHQRSLQSIRSRQQTLDREAAARQAERDRQAAEAARQRELERQAHEAWLRTPEGRAYAERRAREAAERKRQEEIRRRQLQQNLFNTINRIL